MAPERLGSERAVLAAIGSRTRGSGGKCLQNAASTLFFPVSLLRVISSNVHNDIVIPRDRVVHVSFCMNQPLPNDIADKAYTMRLRRRTLCDPISKRDVLLITQLPSTTRILQYNRSDTESLARMHHESTERLHPMSPTGCTPHRIRMLSVTSKLDA